MIEDLPPPMAPGSRLRWPLYPILSWLLYSLSKIDDDRRDALCSCLQGRRLSARFSLLVWPRLDS